MRNSQIDEPIRIHHCGTHVPLPHAPMRDNRLSWQARGLLAYLIAVHPGEDVDTADLAREGRCSEDEILMMWAELEACGYATGGEVRA